VWLSLVDMNDNVHTNPIQTAATQMGFTEAITTQHRPNTPNMHNHGSTPINGIFLAPDVTQNITSGYVAFGEGIPSNHQAVWINILVGVMGWFAPPDTVPLKAWQLKCEDLRIVARCNLALKKKPKATKLNASTRRIGHRPPINMSSTMQTRNHWQKQHVPS